MLLESLLNDENREWTNLSGVYQKPLPTLSLAGESALLQELTRLERFHCREAQEQALLAWLTLLERYSKQKMKDNLRDAIVQEDLDDITPYPYDLVEKACKLWRQNIENKFAPRSVGQLMESVRIEWSERKKRKFRILKLLD